ncbi:hypothetical protein K458DRAFT_158420 [Lentithecium fluviatile CBS 122367]|uniref:Uncharacterized protein n=1 Tax=Lentithecium fluviatile CBS 122367 TaxID=1168545 RepID=A0A6G1IHL1_9PLEO|nr:hypothetical protein K458DRAFT_158420 [Lentithecium fluviatile CBS 122367]
MDEDHAEFNFAEDYETDISVISDDDENDPAPPSINIPIPNRAKLPNYDIEKLPHTLLLLAEKFSKHSPVTVTITIVCTTPCILARAQRKIEVIKRDCTERNEAAKALRAELRLRNRHIGVSDLFSRALELVQGVSWEVADGEERGLVGMVMASEGEARFLGRAEY